MYSNYYFALPKTCRTNSRNASSNLQRSFRPKMNVRQNEKQIILEFSLVGVFKEDIKLSIKDHVLSLEATRKGNQLEKDYQYREFGPIEFKTSLQLSVDVNEDSIQAQFQNGVLKVSMNKATKSNIQVEIK